MRLDELREDLQRVVAHTPDGRADARSEVLHRGRQLVRRRRLARTTTLIAVFAAVIAGALVLRANDRNSTPSTNITTPSNSTTIPTTSTQPLVSRSLASTQLQAFVAAEQAADSAAGAHSAANVWGDPVIAEVSPPVLDGGTYVAAAAFSFEPGGHPVQLLSYENGAWTVTAALPAPSSPGTVTRRQAMDLIAETSPILDTHLTDGAHPDFLVDLAGGGCYDAALVAYDGSQQQWSYVPFFTGPLPTGDIVGGNPQLGNGQLATENDCTAVPVPAAQRVTYTWTYVEAGNLMMGSAHPGWLLPNPAAGHRTG